VKAGWKAGALALAGVVVAAAAMAARGADTTASQLATYMAHMSSANEVPPIAGSASGMATFRLTGKTLSYVVIVSGLSGNAVASNIHIGDAATNGGIVFPFTAANVQSGQVASGTIDLTLPFTLGSGLAISGDSVLTLLNNGQLYTNVHTAANAGGEIRGQITRLSSSSSY